MPKRNRDWNEVPGCCESPWLKYSRSQGSWVNYRDTNLTNNLPRVWACREVNRTFEIPDGALIKICVSRTPRRGAAKRGCSWGGGEVWNNKLSGLGMAEHRDEPIYWWVEVYENGR